MKPIFLTIAHNLFLSKNERYSFSDDNVEISMVGICLPVWVSGANTSEPAEEVYCCYRLRNYIIGGEESVSMTKDGFTISLADKSFRESIKDVKDGGSGSIYLTHQGKLINNGIEIVVIHYINIQDMKVLTREKNAIR
jgi:hypothetical protein